MSIDPQDLTHLLTVINTIVIAVVGLLKGLGIIRKRKAK